MSKKQRRNHEGSVYEEGARSGTPTGRWVAQVWINGKKRRAVATTAAKAKQKLRKMMNDLESGRLVGDGNVTVGQVLSNSGRRRHCPTGICNSRPWRPIGGRLAFFAMNSAAGA